MKEHLDLSLEGDVITNLAKKSCGFTLALLVSTLSFSQTNPKTAVGAFGFGFTAAPIGSQLGLEFSYKVDAKDSLVIGGDTSPFKEQYVLSYRINFWRTFYFDAGLAYGTYTIFAGTDSYSQIEGRTTSPDAPAFAMTLSTDNYGYTLERKYVGSNFALGNRVRLANLLGAVDVWLRQRRTSPVRQLMSFALP